MKKLLKYKQKSYWDCGPAAAKIILKYYNISPSYLELIRQTKCTPEDGTSPENMVKALTKFKLNVEYRMFSNIKELQVSLNRNNPILIAWFSPYVIGSHWSIVKCISEKYITLQDPAIGKGRRIPLIQFSKIWFTIDADANKNYVKRYPLTSVRWREGIFIK